MKAEYKPLYGIYIYMVQLLIVTGYRLNLIMPAISVPHPTAILVRQGLTSSFATNHLRPL